MVLIRRRAEALHVSQAELELLYTKFQPAFEATKHPNGMKKRPGKVSIAEIQALFAFLPCQSASLFLLPLIFHRPLEEQDATAEGPNMTRAEGPRIMDESVVDLAHFIVHTLRFGCMSDLEVVLVLFDAVLPASQGAAAADTVLSEQGLRELIETMHGSSTPELDFLLGWVPKCPMRLTDVASFAMAFPPLFWPLHHFVRTFRRKLFGTRFWSQPGRVRSAKDAESALQRLQVNPGLCDTYSAISSHFDAWRVAMHNLVVMLQEESIRTDCETLALVAEEHRTSALHGKQRKKWKARLRTPALDSITDRLFPHCASDALVGADKVLEKHFQGKIVRWVCSFLAHTPLSVSQDPDPDPPRLPSSHRLPRTRHGYEGRAKGTGAQMSWSRAADPKSGMVFWVNTHTGESRWTHPKTPWLVEEARTTMAAPDIHCEEQASSDRAETGGAMRAQGRKHEQERGEQQHQQQQQQENEVGEAGLLAELKLQNQQQCQS